MSREKLIADALQAARSAKHNMKVIEVNPEVMLPGTAKRGKEYLQMMIDFAEAEIKNAHQARRTSCRTRLFQSTFPLGKRPSSFLLWLKRLLLSIVAGASRADKGDGTA